MFVIGASFISRLKAAAIRCQLPGWKHGSNRLHVQGKMALEIFICREKKHKQGWRIALYNRIKLSNMAKNFSLHQMVETVFYVGPIQITETSGI